MGKDEISPGPVTDPARSRTGYLLIKLGEHAKATAEQALAPLGLRPRHVSVLAMLTVNPEPLSQQEVSRSLRIDPNVMVGLIDDLEDLGLAQRQRNPTDRRRHVVTVTAAGQEILGKAVARLDEAEQAAFSAITPEEKAHVHAVLDRLLTTITSPGPVPVKPGTE
jgi:DNA-binding MarR family transcriptional regulator